MQMREEYKRSRFWEKYLDPPTRGLRTFSFSRLRIPSCRHAEEGKNRGRALTLDEQHYLQHSRHRKQEEAGEQAEEQAEEPVRIHISRASSPADKRPANEEDNMAQEDSLLLSTLLDVLREEARAGMDGKVHGREHKHSLSTSSPHQGSGHARSCNSTASSTSRLGTKQKKKRKMIKIAAPTQAQREAYRKTQGQVEVCQECEEGPMMVDCFDCEQVLCRDCWEFIHAKVLSSLYIRTIYDIHTIHNITYYT